MLTTESATQARTESRYRQRAFGAILLSLIFFSLAYSLQFCARLDPDRYYHLAISKITAQTSLIRALPQADDLTWRSEFPGKDFLFHQYTALAYRLAGEGGVVLGGILLALFCLLGIYAIQLRYLGACNALLLNLAFTVLCPAFANRIILLRPHVFGELFIVLLLYALLHRHRWLSFLSMLFFTLGYSAAFLPFAVLVPAGVSALFICKDRALARACFFGLAGIFVGLITNPYFPSNLYLIFAAAQMALAPRMADINNAGTEVSPYSLRMYFSAFAFPIGSVLATWVFWIRRKFWRTKQNTSEVFADHDLLWLLLAASIFWVLAAITPRGIEHAFPLTAVMAGVFFSKWEGRARAIPLFFVLACALQAPFWWQLAWNAKSDFPDRSVAILENISKIPTSVVGAKVFNCEWDLGAYLLYLRPDLRFVDFLDPLFLDYASPDKYKLRQLLIGGRVPHPAKVIYEIFQSKYVLCSSSLLNEQLLRDPRARLLSEPTALDPLRVFVME